MNNIIYSDSHGFITVVVAHANSAEMVERIAQKVLNNFTFADLEEIEPLFEKTKRYVFNLNLVSESLEDKLKTIQLDSNIDSCVVFEFEEVLSDGTIKSDKIINSKIVLDAPKGKTTKVIVEKKKNYKNSFLNKYNHYFHTFNGVDSELELFEETNYVVAKKTVNLFKKWIDEVKSEGYLEEEIFEMMPSLKKIIEKN